jgi:hypothetical protein
MGTAAIIDLEQETVLASKNEFQVHPESYLPRVFVYVRNDRTWYELLKTGVAIPWTESPESRGFSFWIADVDYMSDFGMYRADKSKRS